MNGYPDNNPKTAFGMKKTPIDLVPTALVRQVALAFENGANKYGAYNWREKKISSSVYYAAAMRHMMDWWEGEDNAPDSGVHHLGHAAACMAMILDTMGSDLLNDNRPPKVTRNGNNPGREGEGSSKAPPKGNGRVLAHARAKRNGKSES